MATSDALRDVFVAGRPLVEQWLDVGEQIAALRDAATQKGLDWSQVKALLKAQVQDERDGTGEGKRIRRIVEKAEFAAAYADMLGLAKMNENIFSPGLPPHDAETGEIIEHHSSAAALTPADEQAGAGSPPRAAPAANSNPPAPTSSPAEADKADDVTLLPASSANPIPDFVPAFLVADARPKPKLRPSRPNCLKPEACAGQGNRHCYSCEKAAAAKGVAFRACEPPKERVGA